jgi:hypothetical protein
MMLIGANSRDVALAVKAKVKENAAELPPGVSLEPIYDRSDFVGQTLATVMRNLIEGALVVTLVRNGVRARSAAIVDGADLVLQSQPEMSSLTSHRFASWPTLGLSPASSAVRSPPTRRVTVRHPLAAAVLRRSRGTTAAMWPVHCTDNTIGKGRLCSWCSRAG